MRSEPRTQSLTDPTVSNLGCESGETTTMVFSGNQGGKPNTKCRMALGKTKCHSSDRPRQLAKYSCFGVADRRSLRRLPGSPLRHTDDLPPVDLDPLAWPVQLGLVPA